MAEQAIRLPAQGYVAQARLGKPAAQGKLYEHKHAQMSAQMDRQLREQGYYVPFGAVCMVVARKTDRMAAKICVT